MKLKELIRAKKKYIKLINNCRKWIREEYSYTGFDRYSDFLFYCREHLPYNRQSRCIMNRAIDLEFVDLVSEGIL